MRHNQHSDERRGRPNRLAPLLATLFLIGALSACSRSVQAPVGSAGIERSDILLLSAEGEQLALQAQTVSGTIEIRLPERDDVLEVAYYVDDLPSSDGAEPISRAALAPFSMDLDTTLLEEGSHTVAVNVTYRDPKKGAAQLVKVGFTVRNGEKSANKAPKVRAGPTLEVVVGAELKITGSVSDDGRPSGQLKVRWSKDQGPAEPTFASPDTAETTVTFPVPGTYILRLTADDGEKSTSDTVRVSVTGEVAKNAAPMVDAGRDLLVTLPNLATLSGVASDDGLPSGRLDLRWATVSGPGSVTFTDASKGTTSAEFSVSGTYVLSLTADDGELSTSDNVTVVVEPDPTGTGTPTEPTPTEPTPTEPTPTEPTPTEPTPTEPTPTEPAPTEPTPAPRGKLELIGDPAFKVSSLPAETQVWYHRFLAALNNPNQYPNIDGAAASGDLYQLGRYVATDITTTLTLFRLTGDLQLLDHVDKVMQIARGQLRDTNGDGYLNWRWLHDKNNASWYGDDKHVMDEIMTHGMVAQVAWAYRQNQDLASPNGVNYRERAAFWADYLQQWETKWRERNRKPTGFPFIYKNLTHPYLNLVRFHWYSYRLTNDEAYLQEATRLANEINSGQLRSISTPNGPGIVFPHGIVKYEPTLDYLVPLHYSEYSTQVLMDLALEPFAPFDRGTTLVPLANTIATKVIDNGSTDFAPTIGGSQAIGGLRMPSGEARTPATRWAIYPISEYAAFDKSGRINAVNRQVYNNIERSNLERPARIAIPAAMVINDLLIN